MKTSQPIPMPCQIAGDPPTPRRRRLRAADSHLCRAGHFLHGSVVKALIVPLMLLAGAVAQEPGSPEWKQALRDSWAQAHREFPESRDRSSELFREIEKLDRWAKENDRALYLNPNKPHILAAEIAPRLRAKPEVEGMLRESLLGRARELALENYLAQGGNLGTKWDKVGPVYTEGPIRGLTKAQAVAKFNGMWAGASGATKQKYVERYLSMLDPEDRKRIERGETVAEPPIWRMFVRNEAFQRAYRDEINEERKQMGLPPLPAEQVEDDPFSGGKVTRFKPFAPVSFTVERTADGRMLIPSNGGEPIFIHEEGRTVIVGGVIRWHVIPQEEGAISLESISGTGSMLIDWNSGLMQLR